MFHKMRHTSFDHITLKYHKMRHMLFSYLFHQHQDQKMTTWSQLDSSYLKATPFAFGAGHVQANCGMDPKLIYDYLNPTCSSVQEKPNQFILE